MLQKQIMDLDHHELGQILKTLIDIMPDGLMIHENGKILYADPTISRLLGYSEEEIINEQIYKFINKEDHEIIKQQLIIKGHHNFKTRLVNKDGKMVHVEINSYDITLKGTEVRIVLFRDLTDLKKRDELVNYQMNFDEITELPNRKQFNRFLNLSMHQTDGYEGFIAILIIDLNDFKNINNSLTYSIGDVMLKRISERIAHSIENKGKIFRMDSEKFSVILQNVNKEETERMAKSIINAFSDSFKVKDYYIYININIGISMFPNDGSDSITLVKNAETALDNAKKQDNNNFRFYEPIMSQDALYNLTLENELRDAITNNELDLYYQPQFNIETGELIGAEALLRWDHTDMGIINPGKFIPLAEKTGMILPIGDWVLKKACLQNKLWQKKGYQPIKISVNLSVKQFHQPNLVKRIKNLLRETGLNSEYLSLELTENIALKNHNTAIRKLMALNELGVELQIDDFGTGFSSLNYLKDFPVQKLKIDKSFVQGIDNSQNKTIIESIVALAKNLNLDVIAEGAELKNHIDYLKSIHCKEVQGFYYSKPIPSDEFENKYLVL